MPPSAVHWWSRLGVRLAAAITLISVSTGSVFLFLMLRSQKRHLMAQAMTSAAVISDTISQSIRYDMLHDRRTEAYQIIDAVGQQDVIERLRLFDDKGRIRFSTEVSEIGQTVDPNAPACSPCHQAAVSASASIAEGRVLEIQERTHVTQRDGQRRLTAVTPIYNEPQCSTSICHREPAAQRVLGLVALDLTLGAVEREAAGLRDSTIALSLVTTLVLGALTFGFTRRLIVRPVMELVEETRRVRAGDLRHHVPVHGTSELGLLEASFNDMEGALSAARAERDALLADLERQVAERSAALERAQHHLIQTEKLTSLGKLSASIAHEINNPLAGILTTAKLILRNLESDTFTEPERRATMRQLKLVERETERCTAIVRNLLGFARERPLTITDADVNAALDEALFLISNQSSLQNIRIDREIEGLPSIEADFGQIRQAFANILINACDAMPKGGRLRVVSRVDAGGSMIEVVISDTGVGIPRDRLSKVVDPFFTTKEKGTGLGLSVVFGIVERHGGTLSIESEVDVGTTVTIRLPVKKATPAEAPPLMSRLASTTRGATVPA